MASAQQAGGGWLGRGSARAHALLARRSSLAAVLCLLVCLVALSAFALIADSVEDQGELTRFDTDLSARITRTAAPGFLKFFRVVTRLGSVPMMTALAVFGGLAMLVRGRRLLAASVAVTALGGGLLDLTLKDLFQRTRPPTPDVSVTERNWSFPSGHSMGSVVGYGMLAYLLILLVVHRRQARVAVATTAALVVLLIGCSRIYLRAHYFSDVLAGYAAGIAWLTVCIGVTEWIRRRRGARSGGAAAGSGAGPPAAAGGSVAGGTGGS